MFKNIASSLLVVGGTVARRSGAMGREGFLPETVGRIEVNAGSLGDA